ncbi:MAG: hypothetical protein AAGB31_13570 [Bdellovibrio sp.]
MKASEIFLDYCAPARDGLPENVTAAMLKKTLMVPELVWNTIVMDTSKNRKLGEIPDILTLTLHTDFPPAHRKQGELLFKFWVQRKDTEFSQHKWPLTTEIYENVKKEVIVRVLVHDNKNQKVSIPKEWSNKNVASVINLRR